MKKGFSCIFGKIVSLFKEAGRGSSINEPKSESNNNSEISNKGFYRMEDSNCDSKDKNHSIKHLDKLSGFFKKCTLKDISVKLLKYFKDNILYAFAVFYNDVLKKKKFLLVLLPGLIIYLIWAGFFEVYFERYTWEDDKPKKIVIPQGMSVEQIAKMLEDSNVVRSSLFFSISAKISGKSSNLYSGVYYLKKGMNNFELIELFTTFDYARLGGRGKITVFEGMRIKQIANLLQKEFNMSAEKFIKASENDSLINLLGLKGKVRNLEGFLFPDTYIVPIDADEEDMVRVFFDEFLYKVYDNKLLNGRFRDFPQKLLDLITLASIVQAETGLINEMPTIAGVYFNRLEKKMKLQADPTIQYVLPDGPRRLLNKDYRIESEYNTYIHEGLPPGPINNPGMDAINSVLNPEKHEYIFFVAGRDKSHRFSKTYEEHENAIREIRQR